MTIYSLDALLSQPRKEPPFIAKPIISQHGLTFLSAQPKAMKSLVAMHMTYDLAEGLPVFGIFGVTGPKRVLYLDQEIGLPYMFERVEAIHNVRRGLNVGSNWYVMSKNLSLKLDTLQEVKGEDGKMKLAGPLVKAIEQAKPDVVVYDPLVCFHSKDENSNSEMHRVMERIMRIGIEQNVASLVVHHFGKESEYRHGADPNRARGASTLWADADTFISLEKVLDAHINKDFIRLKYSLRFRKAPPPTELDIIPLNEDTCTFSTRGLKV